MYLRRLQLWLVANDIGNPNQSLDLLEPQLHRVFGIADTGDEGLQGEGDGKANLCELRSAGDYAEDFQPGHSVLWMAAMTK
jgi:hypothetical protein